MHKPASRVAAKASPVFVEAWTDAQGADRARALVADALAVHDAGVWAAPGRVNLIGEHVDYNGGICLPMALPHRTYVALRPRTDGVVRLVSDVSPADVWTGDVAGIAPGSVRSWAAYAAGPAWALRELGHEVGGFDAGIVSRVPLGAGLSSSAALECAVAAGLDDAFGLGLLGSDDGRAELAAACVRAENEVAGAPTGGMDQAASLRCRAGHALLLDTLDASVEHVPLDLGASGLELLVIDTRAEHSLVDGQYAQRRATCEAAARTLGVAHLRDVTDLDAALASLPDDVARRRVRHVVTEIARVAELAALARAGDLAATGHLLDDSHVSLRDDYEVSCPELDVAVEVAREHGALGARMTGGGFGGSAIALVRHGAAAGVAAAVAAAFASLGWGEPAFLRATAAAGAARVA